MNPDGHTRIPAYLRGRPCRILNCAGTFLFSDARANGKPDVVQSLYTVLFAARDVWGADADGTTSLVADLFESYLEKRT
jgi:nitrile hydratase